MTILVFSVGGGDAIRNVSVNIVRAIKFAKDCGAKVLGIVGRSDGYAAKNGSEAFQAAIWSGADDHASLDTRCSLEGHKII